MAVQTYQVYADEYQMAADIMQHTEPGELATILTRLKVDRAAIAILTRFGWTIETFTPNDVQVRKPVK